MRANKEPGGLEVHVQDVSSSDSVPRAEDLETWIRCALGSDRSAALTLRIVGESEGAELNERYREARGATNVLAFPADEPLPPKIDEPPPLGDIVICAPVLEREARAQDKALEAHWAHICIHGALHLLGFDHDAGENAQLMEAREVELLKSLGFRNPYPRRRRLISCMPLTGTARYGSSMPDELPSNKSISTKSGWWSRLTRRRGDEAEGRDDIAGFLTECRRRNLLASEEHAMLQGVLEVSETQVRDIMVPRSHMIVLDLDEPFDTLLETILSSGHSRFPVIGEDRDEIIGILLAKDLLKRFSESHDTRQFELRELFRQPVFIPESKRLNALLTQFRESHNHIAIVVDEYGGVAGLATIEDVLEQIVGDIDDEHDPEEAENIQVQDDGRVVVLALTRIDDFNEHFDVVLNDEEYDTVGGLIMHELGRLPRRGEVLELAGFQFRVLRADRRRIHAVEAALLSSSSTD